MIDWRAVRRVCLFWLGMLCLLLLGLGFGVAVVNFGAWVFFGALALIGIWISIVIYRDESGKP